MRFYMNDRYKDAQDGGDGKLETFYLVDFENVHDEGLENITALKPTDHVYIFSTQSALKIRMDIVFAKGIDIKGYIVPAAKQSVDMHLVSYLGHLLGIHGKDCSYIIVSKDTDYDNIVKFWKEEGWSNVSREKKILATAEKRNKTSPNFSENDKYALNVFMQHGLVAHGYSADDADKICKCVITHCDDVQMLTKIHNDLINEFNNFSEVYGDVKYILKKFVPPVSNSAEKEAELQFLFEQGLQQKVYIDHKDEIIENTMNAKTKMTLNNGLTKLYSDSKTLKYIYHVLKPFIKDLPGK